MVTFDKYNLFWFQENAKNEEILDSLYNLRPGNGYRPNFPIFGKIEVNGANAHPLFQYLRESLPAPSDDPSPLMGDPSSIIWSPVTRNDISWNFEKFLVGPNGKPFRRYSKKYQSIDIADDIHKLLSTIESVQNLFLQSGIK